MQKSIPMTLKLSFAVFAIYTVEHVLGAVLNFPTVMDQVVAHPTWLALLSVAALAASLFALIAILQRFPSGRWAAVVAMVLAYTGHAINYISTARVLYASEDAQITLGGQALGGAIFEVLLLFSFLTLLSNLCFSAAVGEHFVPTKSRARVEPS